MLKKILVVDEGGISGLLGEYLALQDFRVQGVAEVDEAMRVLENAKEDFDVIIFCTTDDLPKVDKKAAKLNLAANNLPKVLVVKPGVTDNGKSAGIALGNVDMIVPDFKEIDGAIGRVLRM